MKKIIFALLSLVMVLSLCACGDKDKKKEEEIPSVLDNTVTNQEVQNGQPVSPEPTPVVLPPINPYDDYLRGTWINNAGLNTSDTLDHYYGTDKNYMTLSQNGTGSLVLGGNYRDLTWSQNGNDITVTFPVTGETCKGMIINQIIYELDCMENGNEVTYTFIKIVDDKAK